MSFPWAIVRVARNVALLRRACPCYATVHMRLSFTRVQPAELPIPVAHWYTAYRHSPTQASARAELHMNTRKA
eukprot:15117251-Alexandrium_andersonii.AAC.1